MISNEDDTVGLPDTDGRTKPTHGVSPQELKQQKNIENTQKPRKQ